MATSYTLHSCWVPHHLPHSICSAFVCHSFQRWGLNWLNALLNLGPYTITCRIQVPWGWFPEISEHISCFIYPSILASSHSFTHPPSHPLHAHLPPTCSSVHLPCHSFNQCSPSTWHWEDFNKGYGGHFLDLNK